MDLALELTAPERLLIIAVCAAIFLLVLIIMACKLSPFCWLYPYCLFKATYDDQEDRQYLTKQSKDMIGDHPHFWGSLASHQGDPLSDSESRSVYSDHSEMSHLSVPGSWGKDYQSLALRKTYSDASSVDSADLLSLPISQAEVELCTQWDKTLQVLNVQISQLRGLSERQTSSKSEVNMKIQLLKYKVNEDAIDQDLPADVEKFLVDEKHTEAKKRAPTLQLNEIFNFNMSADILAEHCIRVVVFEVDKLSHMESKGEVVVPISKSADGVERNMVLPLKFKAKESMGELMISLMYLPTAEKLFITLSECKDLKNLKESPDSEIQVKVSLIFSGSRRDRKRSKSHRAASHATLTETLTFDVPQRNIGEISILLVLQQTLVESTDEATEAEKPIMIGRTVLGLNVESSEARMHWLEMLNNPRKHIVLWQSLY